MAGKIICSIVAFGCAVLFYGIGAYAIRSKKPMSFWSGVAVDAATLTDVELYNQENGAMWKRYSLWYFAAGAAVFWSEIAFAILLGLSCSLGIGLLIASYTKIHKKYKKTGL